MRLVDSPFCLRVCFARAVRRIDTLKARANAGKAAQFQIPQLSNDDIFEYATRFRRRAQQFLFFAHRAANIARLSFSRHALYHAHFDTHPAVRLLLEHHSDSLVGGSRLTARSRRRKQHTHCAPTFFLAMSVLPQRGYVAPRQRRNSRRVVCVCS